MSVKNWKSIHVGIWSTWKYSLNDNFNNKSKSQLFYFFLKVFEVVYFCSWISYLQYLIILILILKFVFLYLLDNLPTSILKFKNDMTNHDLLLKPILHCRIFHILNRISAFHIAEKKQQFRLHLILSRISFVCTARRSCHKMFTMFQPFSVGFMVLTSIVFARSLNNPFSRWQKNGILLH